MEISDKGEGAIDSTLGQLVSIDAYRLCFKQMLLSKPQNKEQALLTMMSCGQDFLKYIASYEMGMERAMARQNKR